MRWPSVRFREFGILSQWSFSSVDFSFKETKKQYKENFILYSKKDKVHSSLVSVAENSVKTHRYWSKALDLSPSSFNRA